MFALLRTWSLQELRHHPWRSAAACAVMLGVALAFAVHTINASALDEFAQAVRNVSGQPDVQLRAVQGQVRQRGPDPDPAQKAGRQRAASGY